MQWADAIVVVGRAARRLPPPIVDAEVAITEIDKVADWPAAINEIMPVGLQIMNGRVTEAFLRTTRLM